MIPSNNKVWAFNTWIYSLEIARSIILIPFLGSIIISFFSPSYIWLAILSTGIFLLTWFTNFWVAKCFQQSSLDFFQSIYRSNIEPLFLVCSWLRRFVHLLPLEDDVFFHRLEILSRLENIYEIKVERYPVNNYVKRMQAMLVPDRKILHIVLDDTLWGQGLNDDHRLALAAHEQGHYSLQKKKERFDKEFFISFGIFLIGNLILLGYIFIIIVKGYSSIALILNNPSREIFLELIVTWICFQIYLILLKCKIRKVEFEADAYAVKILDNPEWLIEALQISYDYSLLPSHVPGIIEMIFEDHPSLDKRIKRIRDVAYSKNELK